MSTLWNCKFCEGDTKFDGTIILTIRCRCLEVRYWGRTEKGKHSNTNLNITSVVMHLCYVMILFEKSDT